MSPTEACRDAIARIARKFPSFHGAVIAVNNNGEHGAATHGFQQFPYAYRTDFDLKTHVDIVQPTIAIDQPIIALQ